LCACRCILCDPRRSLRRAPAPSSPVAARLPIQSRATPVGRIAPCLTADRSPLLLSRNVVAPACAGSPTPPLQWKECRKLSCSHAGHLRHIDARNSNTLALRSRDTVWLFCQTRPAPWLFIPSPLNSLGGRTSLHKKPCQHTAWSLMPQLTSLTVSVEREAQPSHRA
jgi:hypothetical protein